MITKYYIPTRDRAGDQKTLRCLPKQILKNTFIVCEKNQRRKYILHCKDILPKKNIIPFPQKIGRFLIDGYGCFSDKKQWIIENTDSNFLFFLDDDFNFSVRKKSKLIRANKAEVGKYLNIMKDWMELEGLAHVGMSARGGNNRVKQSFIESTRGTGVVGFNISIIKKENIKMNRLILMSDLDTTLTLLEKGYKNKVTYDCAYDQKGTNTDGGCSKYRTEKTMKESAFKLQSLHAPGIVNASLKKTKHVWSGFDTNKRWDVTIQWKKAYKQGLMSRNKNITDFLS